MSDAAWPRQKDDELRAFAERDWALLARMKRERSAAELAKRGPSWSFALASSMRDQVRRLHPEWPTDEERAADLAHHVECQRLLQKTHALLGR